jgi:hypothetical protein
MFNKRMQKAGMQRWHKYCEKYQDNLTKGEKLMKAKYKIFARSAFRLYKFKVEMIKYDHDQE